MTDKQEEYEGDMMVKKLIRILAVSVMAVSLAACGAAQNVPAAAGTGDTGIEQPEPEAAAQEPEETPAEPESAAFRIGIVTGSLSQSEDDRRGAEAFQEKYGMDSVTLAIYPDNFTEEPETTIRTIVNLSDDPLIKAIVVNQAVDKTTSSTSQRGTSRFGRKLRKVC